MLHPCLPWLRLFTGWLLSIHVCLVPCAWQGAAPGPAEEGWTPAGWISAVLHEQVGVTVHHSSECTGVEVRVCVLNFLTRLLSSPCPLQVPGPVVDVLLLCTQVVCAGASVSGEFETQNQSCCCCSAGISTGLHLTGLDPSPSLSLQPYFPDVAAALLEHMAPSSVRQPRLPGDAQAAASSNGQVQSSDAVGQATEAHLKAADSALLAAQQAAAAASAAAAALFAAQAGAAQQPQTPQQPPPAQQPLASPPHQQLAEMPVARSPAVTLRPSDPGSSMQQQAVSPALARPTSADVRPAKPPPGLQLEPSLPDRDMPPGKPS